MRCIKPSRLNKGSIPKTRDYTFDDCLPGVDTGTTARFLLRCRCLPHSKTPKPPTTLTHICSNEIIREGVTRRRTTIPALPTIAALPPSPCRALELLQR